MFLYIGDYVDCIYLVEL